MKAENGLNFGELCRIGNAPHWKCGSLTGIVRSSRTLSASLYNLDDNAMAEQVLGIRCDGLPRG